jgi:AraC-like DNA-binding protein
VEADDSYSVHQRNGFSHPGIFISLEGRGTYIDEQFPDSRYTLEAPSYFIVDRHRPCFYECPAGARWKFYYLHFSDLLMIKQLQIPIMQSCRFDDRVKVTRCCEEMIECLIHAETGYMYQVNHLFQDLALSFAHENREPSGRKNKKINELIYWIHQNVDKTIDMESMIMQTGISRTNFYKLFKEETGLTPNAYSNKIKLESARLSLLTTNLTIRQIAHSLQFCDEFHFTKSFKKEFGISPSIFRKSHADL